MESETLTTYWKEIGLVGLLCGAAATVIAMFVFFYAPQAKAAEKIDNMTYTRAFTLWGTGATGKMSCTGTKKIKINKGTYMCALNSTDKDTIDIKCDPFLPNGNYNPAATFDAIAHLKAECNGKSACSVRLPNMFETGQNDCQCPPQDVVLNASYYCVPDSESGDEA